MSFIVISTSLNSNSRSAILAREAYKILQGMGKEVEWLDLRDLALPQCDGDKAYADPNVSAVTEKIANASSIIVAVAIYNYDCGSSAKNLLELTGRAWEDKTVAFLCAAGGRSSYMSIMSFANSLMLDFRSVIVPRFVYAEGSAFADNAIIDEKIKARVQQMIDATIKLDGAM